jgi:hypothetical protein
MGLDIKRNDNGLYQIHSTISDEKMHDENWITEHEVKKLLIERAFWNFVESMIKIDDDFPHGYMINNVRGHSIKGLEEIMELHKSTDGKDWEKRYMELKTKYNLDI